MNHSLNLNGRTYLPNTHIEIIKPHRPCAPLRHVLFDFDGTISLIREGWQKLMAAMMVEFWLDTPQAEDEAALAITAHDYVLNTMGRPTIDQMAHLSAEVSRRGGQAQSPAAYKHIYLERLLARVNARLAALQSGQVSQAELMVPGVSNLLATLVEQGIVCYLASGTERHAVIAEAEALGVSGYFDDRIYGPDEHSPTFSKKQVIQKILRDHHLPGCALVSFGDGKAETEYIAEVGGIAVGVASNEIERQGLDEIKRQQLIQAGADLIAPDFREYEPLLRYLNDADEAKRW
jgi:phosphoglycolate phosphatase-like HAD superfamily hydrolase